MGSLAHSLIPQLVKMLTRHLTETFKKGGLRPLSGGAMAEAANGFASLAAGLSGPA